MKCCSMEVRRSQRSFNMSFRFQQNVKFYKSFTLGFLALNVLIQTSHSKASTNSLSNSRKLLGNEESFHEVFPEGFRKGCSSSAFQYEGAFDEDDKGRSIWDEFSLQNPSPIADKSNANISCDFYHKYKDDVKLIKSIGANVFRFSISWPRILPKGTTEVINQKGIDFYNKLIDELISQGIEPIVCLYHWDLPQNLLENGGWLNKETIGLFGDFARLAYKNFGDRVKIWVTMNEPFNFCYYGYDKGIYAPGIQDPAVSPYACVHSLILAHALAYRIYREEFKLQQKGRVGISLDNVWQEPADPNSEDDRKAAEQSNIFRFDWIAYPLFKGEYPPLMRRIIDKKSIAEKRKISRLPTFDGEWAKHVNGSLDFLGINHFTSETVKFSNKTGSPSWESDSGTIRSYDPSWASTGSKWLKVNPQGIRKALNKIKSDYNNPEVLITANGVSDRSTELEASIDDSQRILYHRFYIMEVLKAMHLDGCNVKGYLVYSLLDAFEWNMGYSEKFGLFHVNHSDPNRTRTAKKSAMALKQIFNDNGFPNANFKISVIDISTKEDGRIDENSYKYSPTTVLIYSSPFVMLFSAYYAYNHA